MPRVNRSFKDSKAASPEAVADAAVVVLAIGATVPVALAQGGGRAGSLLDAIDCTVTGAGARLLGHSLSGDKLVLDLALADGLQRAAGVRVGGGHHHVLHRQAGGLVDPALGLVQHFAADIDVVDDHQDDPRGAAVDIVRGLVKLLSERTGGDYVGWRPTRPHRGSILRDHRRNPRRRGRGRRRCPAA